MAIVLTELQHKQIEKNSKTKLQAFQRKIYRKAKQNPKYKFYCLYDKVFREDTLREAYKRVKASKGASGIDKIGFKDLEGREKEFIKEIHKELKAMTYKPQKLKEVKIPKSNGKTRTLKIPTIKDRVVQMAVKLIIEPIFEAEFENNSYGYRPKRGAYQAINEIRQELFQDIYKSKENKREVKSIDLTDCFNTIPQRELIRIIAQRIIDRQLIKLVRMIIETGKDRERSQNGDNKGTPQGGVLSPLLANIYLDKADKYWKQKGKLSKMVRYADDVIVILNPKEEQEFKEYLSYIEQELKLIVNKEKTKTTTVQKGINYLGFTLREKTSKRHKQYLSVEPSKKAISKVKETIKAKVKYNRQQTTEGMIKEVNATLRGWQNYFDNNAMGKTRNKIKQYVELKVMRMISRRNKRSQIRWKLFEKGKIYSKYGLHKMTSLGRKFT